MKASAPVTTPAPKAAPHFLSLIGDYDKKISTKAWAERFNLLIGVGDNDDEFPSFCNLKGFLGWIRFARVTINEKDDNLYYLGDLDRLYKYWSVINTLPFWEVTFGVTVDDPEIIKSYKSGTILELVDLLNRPRFKKVL